VLTKSRHHSLRSAATWARMGERYLYLGPLAPHRTLHRVAEMQRKWMGPHSSWFLWILLTQWISMCTTMRIRKIFSNDSCGSLKVLRALANQCLFGDLAYIITLSSRLSWAESVAVCRAPLDSIYNKGTVRWPYFS
jgi:hypothetical protein